MNMKKRLPRILCIFVPLMSFILTLAAKILASCLVAWAVGAPQNSSAQVRGSIELSEANALLKAYAAHFVEQQPREFRRAWRNQVDQVKLSESGLYALTGVDGRVVIEYLPNSKILHCLSSIHSFRGVVRPWVFRALQEAAARGVSTNGAELIYDPESKAIFVRKTFVDSPVREKDFIKTCDRVMKTGERWGREHFLPALNAFYARHAPPASATERSGDFRATLVLAEDKAAFQDVWDRPATAREPAIWTLDRIAVGEPVYAFVLFSGCAPDAAGRSLTEASFEILRPDGSSLVSVPVFPLWNGRSPPAGHLQMSEKSLDIAFDEEEPLGSYRIRSKVCDRGSQRCVELSLPIELVANRP